MPLHIDLRAPKEDFDDILMTLKRGKNPTPPSIEYLSKPRKEGYKMSRDTMKELMHIRERINKANNLEDVQKELTNLIDAIIFESI